MMFKPSAIPSSRSLKRESIHTMSIRQSKKMKVPSTSMNNMYAAATAAASSSSMHRVTTDDDVNHKPKKKGGSSCHQCKSRRNLGALTYCTSNLDKKNKSCRKKFCEHCLKKFYKESPFQITDKSSWRCPSCRKICCCAACRRRKAREAGQNSGGPPQSSSSSSKSSKTSRIIKHTNSTSSTNNDHNNSSSNVKSTSSRSRKNSSSSNNNNNNITNNNTIAKNAPKSTTHTRSSNGNNNHHHHHHHHHKSKKNIKHSTSAAPIIASFSRELTPEDLASLAAVSVGSPPSPELYNGHTYPPPLSLHSDDSDSGDESDSIMLPLTPEQMELAKQMYQEEFNNLYSFARVPRVKKHIKYILIRTDLTEQQKVETIANLLRAGADDHMLRLCEQNQIVEDDDVDVILK